MHDLDLHVISTFEAPQAQLLSTIIVPLCTSTIANSFAITKLHLRMDIWSHRIVKFGLSGGEENIYNRNTISFVVIKKYF